jgi:tetratricopeptide (TPR) repeat protein
MSVPELVLAPAQRGPWGVVTRLSGPPDPPDTSPHPELRRARALLWKGMIVLSRHSSDERVRYAERLFRQALTVLLSSVGEIHPKVAYARDRIGLVCQIRGRTREAELQYLRALALREAGGWPATLWSEVTLLNLAILYARQGRDQLRDAMLERLRRLRDAEGSEGA